MNAARSPDAPFSNLWTGPRLSSLFGPSSNRSAASRRTGEPLTHLNNSFNKPEYVFRPRQILRRFAIRPKGADDTAEVLLPWGLPFRIRPQEVLGRAIWNTGVYDLAVSEALWRLTRPGETAVDAGAN